MSEAIRYAIPFIATDIGAVSTGCGNMDGFIVYQGGYNQSTYPELANIDIRGDAMSLYHEAIRRV